MRERHTPSAGGQSGEVDAPILEATDRGIRLIVQTAHEDADDSSGRYLSDEQEAIPLEMPQFPRGDDLELRHERSHRSRITPSDHRRREGRIASALAQTNLSFRVDRVMRRGTTRVQVRSRGGCVVCRGNLEKVVRRVVA